MTEYQEQISQNQNKIENHNVDYDYVNLLLNDVGNKTYYNGYDYGEGGILEAHCPNTFFQYDKDGNPIMNISSTGQSPEMKAMDEFLNNYLRGVAPSDKAAALELIGTLVQGGFGGEMDGELFDILMDPDNQDKAAYLLSYLIEYEQAHPEFKEQIKSVLSRFGMSEINQYVDIVDGILNNKYFDVIVDAVDWVSGHIPDFVIEWVLKWAKEKYGIELTVEQARNLLGLIGKVNGYMDKIKIQDNGSDIVIEDASFGNIGEIKVIPNIIVVGITSMESISKEIAMLNTELEQIRVSMDFSNFGMDLVIRELKRKITRLSTNYNKIASAMSECLNTYQQSEKEIEELFQITVKTQD